MSKRASSAGVGAATRAGGTGAAMAFDSGGAAAVQQNKGSEHICHKNNLAFHLRGIVGAAIAGNSVPLLLSLARRVGFFCYLSQNQPKWQRLL